MFGKKRRNHEKSILDNPEEFFNSMSREEFKDLLDEFGFEYIDLEDINITKSIYELGKLHSIYLIDHLIIGKNTYYSFYENNHILNNK